MLKQHRECEGGVVLQMEEGRPLVSLGAAPLVEAIRRDEATAVFERATERGGLGHVLDAGVDVAELDLRVPLTTKGPTPSGKMPIAGRRRPGRRPGRVGRGRCCSGAGRWGWRRHGTIPTFPRRP